MKTQFYFGIILFVVDWITQDVKATSTSMLPTTARAFTTRRPRLRTMPFRRPSTRRRIFPSLPPPNTIMETTVTPKPPTAITDITKPVETVKEISKSESDNTTTIGVSVAPILILVGLALCILCLIRQRTPRKNKERNSGKNRKRNSREKNSEPSLPTVTPCGPSENPIVVTSVAGSSSNGNPSNDHAVVFDTFDKHRYSDMGVAKGKEPNAAGELCAAIEVVPQSSTHTHYHLHTHVTLCDVQKKRTNEEEVIMQENEELYNSIDSCTAEFGRELEKGCGNENGYEVLQPKERTDENDKKHYESLNEKEPINENKTDVHDRESVIMFENDELYLSSVNLAEDGTELNPENEEHEYYEIIEETNQSEKKIRKKDSVILSKSLQGSYKTRQSLA